ncbi:MAG: hypothetical protein SFX72_05395 [Isosphaeraceae bacterium]|nr:hypothetical protein [Isosphaeraceae bacterium]
MKKSSAKKTPISRVLSEPTALGLAWVWTVIAAVVIVWWVRPDPERWGGILGPIFLLGFGSLGVFSLVAMILQGRTHPPNSPGDDPGLD